MDDDQRTREMQGRIDRFLQLVRERHPDFCLQFDRTHRRILILDGKGDVVVDRSLEDLSAQGDLGS